MGKQKILFVLFGDPMMFPPTMNAASILAERGWSVDIIGIRVPSGEAIEFPNNVNVIYLGEMKTRISLRIQYARFCFKVAQHAKLKKYACVIGYDMMASIPAFLASKFAQCPFLYHNHDLMDTNKCHGVYWMIKKAELYLAKKALFVIFPQKERAAIFSMEANLSRMPQIVLNAPRLSWIGNGLPDERLIEFRKRCGRVVLFQGGMAANRGIDLIIKALPYFETGTGLCLVGKELEAGYKQRMMSLARELGVADRLLLLDVVSYNDLSAITKYCDIGVGVPMPPESAACSNLQHLAGASNKIFEYMTCGLPIVAPNSAAYREILSPPANGLLYDNAEPKAISEPINRLLRDRQLSETISNNNTRDFKERYNYDVQFSPVVDLLEGILRCNS